MPYIITAVRNDERMQSVRHSSLIALAKARVWESEGWDVVVADPDGRVHGFSQSDAHVAAFKSSEPVADADDDEDAAETSQDYLRDDAISPLSS